MSNLGSVRINVVCGDSKEEVTVYCYAGSSLELEAYKVVFLNKYCDVNCKGKPEAKLLTDFTVNAQDGFTAHVTQEWFEIWNEFHKKPSA